MDEHNLCWNNDNAEHNLGSLITKWMVEEYYVCEKITNKKSLLGSQTFDQLPAYIQCATENSTRVMLSYYYDTMPPLLLWSVKS